MNKGTPIVAISIDSRTINASRLSLRGDEHAAVADSASVDIEIVSPDRILSRVTEVHGLVVGTKCKPVRCNDATLHLVTTSIGVKPVQAAVGRS